MFNRLQVRIIIVISAITLIFVAGLFFINKWQRNNLKKAVKDFELQQHNLLNSVIRLHANSTQSMSLDFSLWDEMVSFIDNKDTIWANANLKNTLPNYKTNHIWIFTKEFNLVYYASDKPGVNISNVLPEKDQLADIVRESHFLHFFYKTSLGFVEIFGAPIQPMSDKQRTSEPRGWLFAGMNWSPETLNEIASMTSSKLELDTAAFMTSTNRIMKDNSTLVHSAFVMESWSGRPIGTLRSVSTLPFLLEYRKGSRYFLSIGIIFLVVLLSVISFILFRTVGIPLKYLNKTLELRDIRYIEPLKNYKTDFGRLSRSILTIFEKENLLQETEKRRRLESELRKSEQRFHLLVENLPDILWIANAEGDTIYYSSNLTNVLGYQSDELLNNENFWGDNIHPDDYQSVTKRYSSFVNDNHQFEVEYRLKHKNGQYRWISEKAISKFEHDGIQYCCGRLTDITEEKLIELRLFDSEQQFRALFEQNPFGVALMELNEQKIITVNPALSEMLGYIDNELKGKKLHSITPAEDLQQEMELSVVAKEKGDEVFTVEKRLYRKDGDLIWVNLTASYIKDKTGKNVYAVGIIENITEKKQIQDKLSREHNLLVSLMDHVPDLIFFKNIDGRYITVNNAATNFYSKMGFADPVGYYDQDIMGTQELFDEIRKDEINIFATGLPLINKLEKIELPDGEIRWFSVTKIPIFTPDGKNDILVGILRNITERIENEQKLKDYALELKELNLSKDKFVTILAHDLKNPFNAILGFASILLEEYNEYSDEERMHFIRNIKQSADNTYNLIQNILEWSRSQTSRISFNPVYLDLSEIVNACVELLKIAMNEKEVQFINNVPVGTTVFADENMMRTVIRNLVSNAFKFSDKGKIVKVNSRPLNHGLLEVSVEDEGIGIPEEALERLFKIDDSYRREGTQGEQGTGLGLILCKEFIEKNGGLIWVTSREGEGSRFMFTIPVEKPV